MHSNFLVSVFVEPTVKLFDALLLAGGIRLDQSTVYDKVLTPKVGARYNIGKQSFRFN
jgi:outer membrane receptor for ferrienterochelin and colicin